MKQAANSSDAMASAIAPDLFQLPAWPVAIRFRQLPLGLAHTSLIRTQTDQADKNGKDF